MASKPEKDNYTLIKEAYARAERVSGDGSEVGGTGATVLKQRLSPVAHLLRPKHDRPPLISMVEQRAADDILYAVTAVTSPLRIRSPQMEYVDCRAGHDVNAIVGRKMETIRRYQAWANIWSKRRNLYGDPMLEIVFAGVVDETPFKVIGANVGRRYAVVRDGFIAGLRDYAARAGWVTREEAKGWIAAAENIFRKC